MAKLTSRSHLSGVAPFPDAWSALVECASPAHDCQRLDDLLASADWERLLVLAEKHGVNGHLASCLCDLEVTKIPSEVRQTLIERQRAQTFFTLSLTAELIRILETFTSEGLAALVATGAFPAMHA